MKKHKIAVTSTLVLILAAGVAWLGISGASAAGTTRYVANGGSDTTDCSLSGAPCATINYAVGQSAAGDTISVAAGIYNENVNVPATLTGLTINGAQAGNAVSGRTFGGVTESKVSSTTQGVPVFQLRPSNVRLDGFSISDTPALFAATGVDVKNTVNGAVITNNMFDGISTGDTTSNGTAQAVYLEAGPDGVQIIGNSMNNIHSNRSAKGVLIGDSNSTNSSTNVVIQGNSISNVISDIKGAYGVQINNGNGSTSNTGLQIQNNSISNLTGTAGWVHAIGLEANTPGVVVAGNTITNVVAPGTDRVAIWFEDEDISFATGLANNNNLDVSSAAFGIAVHPSLPAGQLNGTCNWWGSATGPTAASNPGGTGSQVSTKVTYKPWLISAAPGGACIGGNVPSNKDQCKNDGWKTQVRADGSTFKNQGDCIQYVNTGK